MSLSNPQVMIQYSDDGGRTWSHEIWHELVGSDKNYLNRIRLHRMGSAYQRRWRLKCSEDMSFTLISAHADISVGV